MALAIEQDQRRFRQIVRGKIKQNLRQYMSNGEMIGRQGKKLVTIPVPEIDLPNFRFGGRGKGVSQGDGEVGSPIGQGNSQDGDQKAGDRPGSHTIEVELSYEELAQLLGEELALPRIQPKSKNNVEGIIHKFNGMRRVGPEGLRYFKRTYREALKRQLATGSYDYNRPSILPIREDKRYRSWKDTPRPDSNAVIIYMMDVSGSMSDRKKELVRLTAFWIDTWIQFQYRNVTTRYIVHDVNAQEVDANTFYSIHESGGTKISSAYDLCNRMIKSDFDPSAWNLYAFHFSDGENFDIEDDRLCAEIISQELLPAINLFCYGQVRSSYGHQFIDTLAKIEHEKLASSRINDEDDIYTAIKNFLGKGY